MMALTAVLKCMSRSMSSVTRPIVSWMTRLNARPSGVGVTAASPERVVALA
jgi:hypothetical protein